MNFLYRTGTIGFCLAKRIYSGFGLGDAAQDPNLYGNDYFGTTSNSNLSFFRNQSVWKFCISFVYFVSTGTLRRKALDSVSLLVGNDPFDQIGFQKKSHTRIFCYFRIPIKRKQFSYWHGMWYAASIGTEVYGNGTTAGLGYLKVGLEWPYNTSPGQWICDSTIKLEDVDGLND